MIWFMDERRTRTTFLCLLALSHSPMHGYEISKFIENKSAGFFRVPFGSLYPVLHRLELDRLILAQWEAGAKPKKTYTLTESGRSALRQEILLFDSLALAINQLTPASL
jgi:PadR family transcriptional regulator PadR